MPRPARFELERWFTRYGFTARHNICASGAAPLHMSDLLERLHDYLNRLRVSARRRGAA